ncbi:hypothetical protein M408DRAFT_216541 [Serendipita vermifera MAFF 305830]|uniref:Uncharacterized protein n=1 Tax=Serendipita vermifera MAFF 305830 TaxID=933852 RepID=A0A0C3B642_SERVB|nr:hypothetical protein M408DRAFT_216541 [Serendipita vermifera MAFF 305830]
MDPVLQPPLRIAVSSSESISSKNTAQVLSSFLGEYQARDGDAAVNAQMQRLIAALEEESKQK